MNSYFLFLLPSPCQIEQGLDLSTHYSKCKFTIRTPLLDMNLQKYKLEHDQWKYPYKAKARHKSNDFYFETSQVPPVSELAN